MSAIRLIETTVIDMLDYGTRRWLQVPNGDNWRQKKSIENALRVSSECSRGKGLKDCAAQKTVPPISNTTSPDLGYVR